jgi:isopentenyldiphosphate isomerase
MINKDEIIFGVDEFNRPTGGVLRRKAHTAGLWHRTTDIVVVNSKNEVLAHKRSMQKDSGPGLWDPVFGGHMAPGAEAVMAAREELREEAGLDVKPSDLKFFAICRHVSENRKNKEYRYGYIYHWDGKAEDIHFEKDEITEVKWVSLETLKNNRDNRSEWSPMPCLDELLKNLN